MRRRATLASDDPITDWSVSTLVERTAAGEEWKPVVTNVNRGVLHPRREITMLLDPGIYPRSVQVTFIDSAGERWWREGAEVRRV